MRGAGAAVAVLFGASTVWFAFMAADGQLPALGGAAATLAGAVLAIGGAGYPLRYRVALDDGTLTITGLFRTRRVPVQYIVRARRGTSGVVFDLYDGRRVAARGLEIHLFDSWLRDYALCAEVLDAVQAAAQRAQERHPLIPADNAVIKRNVLHRRNALIAQSTVFAVLAALAAFAKFDLDHTSGSANQTPGATASAAPSLAVGQYISSPNDPALTPIPCSSPHSAQIYSLVYATGFVATTSDDDCDESLIESASLPPTHSEQYIMTTINGTMTDICLIVTSPITHSVVRGH